MEHITEARKQLKEFSEKATMAFESSINTGDPELKLYAPAYVYYMKLYFEFCAETKYKDKIDFNVANSLLQNINNTVKAITNLTKIDYKPIKVIKKGSMEMTSFYLMHKAKLESFTIMPKNASTEKKIIKTLEIWTGAKGKDAVIKTMDRLISDSNFLFDYMIKLHNISDISNKKISAKYQQYLQDILSYYLRHKKKYCPGTETKSIHINDGVKLKLKDEFVDIKVKFKYCDFPGYATTIKTIIEGITKIDRKAIARLINNFSTPEFISSNAQSEEQIIENLKYRKNTKDRIIAILDEIKEDLECYESDIKYSFDEKKYSGGETIPILLDLIRKFLEVEKIAENEIKLIHENLETQNNNIEMLIKASYELIGPSTAPCIMLMLPALKYILDKRKLYTKKGKISPEGETLIKSLV